MNTRGEGFPKMHYVKRHRHVVKCKVFYCLLTKKAVGNMQALKAGPKITIIHRPSGHRILCEI